MTEPADHPPSSPSGVPQDPAAAASKPDVAPEAGDGSTSGPAEARFNLDVTGASAAEALAKLRDNVAYWVARGRYNKVRIKRGGKAVLPDIPVGALIAVEAATFFSTGLLRAALVNVVGRALFEVELVNEAEGFYKKGLEHFLAGDVADAEKLFTRALEVDDRFARAHLQMGVLRKVQGNTTAAVRHFERVLELDRHSDAGREAKVHLTKLRPTPPAAR
jgi:tetratricopeptide (TPR) repeat protein